MILRVMEEERFQPLFFRHLCHSFPDVMYRPTAKSLDSFSHALVHLGHVPIIERQGLFI